MKRILTLVLMLFIWSTTRAQDTVHIVHTNYTTVYSKSLKYPLLVEWWDTRAKVQCTNPEARKDQFAPDPQDVNDTKIQADYDSANKAHKRMGLKGFDRGHMCPAADNLCQTPKVQTECFYFSNMAPQYHALNAGDWKSLETAERQWSIQNDSVHIWCGSLGRSEVFGPDSLAVPVKCWKVLFIVRTNEWLAYLFNNLDEKQTGINPHRVDVKVIVQLTGFKFN